MQLGFELITERLLNLTDGDAFEVYISVDHQPVMQSSGSDEFHVNGVILSGGRVTATGRKMLIDYHWFSCGLGSLEAF